MIAWISSYISLPALVLIAVLLAGGFAFWKMHKDNSSKFRVDHLLLDSNEKSSTSQLAVIVALVISSWAFVHLTLHDKLSEWYVAAYMGIWVLNKSTNKWLDIKKEIEGKLDKK